MAENISPIRLYLRNTPNIVMFSLSIVLNLVTWGWLLWYIHPQEEHIFLHYNVLFGVDLTGRWWEIYRLPASGTLIILVNAILGWIVFHKDKFMAHIMNSIAVLCQIFLLIGAVILVYLNV